MKLSSSDGWIIIIVFHSNCYLIHIEHPLSILSVFIVYNGTPELSGTENRPDAGVAVLSANMKIGEMELSHSEMF